MTRGQRGESGHGDFAGALRMIRRILQGVDIDRAANASTVDSPEARVTSDGGLTGLFSIEEASKDDVGAASRAQRRGVHVEFTTDGLYDQLRAKPDAAAHCRARAPTLQSISR